MAKYVSSLSVNHDPKKELLRACASGDVHMVKELVRIIDDLNYYSYGTCPPEFERCTPLLLAIHYGHFQIVKVLIESGSDVESYLGETFDGDEEELLPPIFDAVHLCCPNSSVSNGQDGPKIVRYLIEAGAEVWADVYRKAVLYGGLEILKMLVETMPKDTTAENYEKSGVLFDNTKPPVKEEERNFNIDEQMDDKDNETLLMCAARLGHVDIVEYLVSKNASTTIRNKHGQTAYKVAYEELKNKVKLHMNRGYDEVTVKEAEDYIKDNPESGEPLREAYEMVAVLEDVTPTKGLA